MNLQEVALPQEYTTHRKQIIRNRKREYITYLDIPFAFDIETYSWREANGEKRATMWGWSFATGQDAFIGRTWGEWLDLLEHLRVTYGLNDDRRIIIWVHNLSYEHSFFRRYLTFKNVFAIDSREVCYASTYDGIDFRCSYLLTGYSLEKVAEHLTKHTIRKLVGDIDYHLPRHTKTVLTDKEKQYMLNDVLIVTAHIAEQIEAEGGDITKIPLTKTGYVRRYVRNKCFRNPAKKASEDNTKRRYHTFIKGLTLDPFIYESMRRAFQGGYTHANPWEVGEVSEHVESFDFASAYPAAICSELYPMTPPELLPPPATEEELEHLIKYHCCIFTVHFTRIESRFSYDHYLSESRCIFGEGAQRQISNGRIVWAEDVTTTITEVDWDIIRKTYKTVGDVTFSGIIRFGKSYLPKPIIESVMDFYQAKTRLKGEAGKELEYLSAKEMLNSIYGMFVQAVLRMRIPYDLDTNAWGEADKDGQIKIAVPLTDEEAAKALEDYNKDFNRFTYYAWGVYITAYTRRNLWSGILECGEDYRYSDTDSIKIVNAEAHRDYIKAYNQRITEKIRACLEYYNMDVSLMHPKTPKGVEKQMGIWEDEGEYLFFKSLGAKRYMIAHRWEDVKPDERDKYAPFIQRGKQLVPYTGADPESDQPIMVSVTISGVNKRVAMPYIHAQGGDPFEFFNNQMEIPAGYAGKQVPYYGDEAIGGVLTDHLGVTFPYKEMSFVNLEEAGYSLKMAPVYVDFLDSLRKGVLDGEG